MRMFFYPRLAVDGIRKNKRLYVPFLLTCAGMIAMRYIISFLSTASYLDHIAGGSDMRMILGTGVGVISVFAAVFLFYTHSFLVRRRKKEFGLYNILGMGKINIARIMFWEMLVTAAISLLTGLTVGIAFSKLAELGMVNVLHGKISYTFRISGIVVLDTVRVFAVIFVLLFLNTLRQVQISDPIALLHSENAGEKPPKANWILAVVGVIFLAAAYYVAVTTKQPLNALILFFAAVIMVILGTYLLFIAGSVALCKVLQKKKSYYYQANHFVSVSSMTYRMKRNGAGLASICILSTMVLVMISGSACLYFGEEDGLRTRYPRELTSNVSLEHPKNLEDDNIKMLRDAAEQIVKNCGAGEPSNVIDYRYAQVSGILGDGVLNVDLTVENEFFLDAYENLYQVYFVPLSDYNAMTGEHEQLSAGEALLYTSRGSYSYDTLTIPGKVDYHVVKTISDFPVNVNAAMDIITSLFLVVPDMEEAVGPLLELTYAGGNPLVGFRWYYGFDTGADLEIQKELLKRFREQWESYSITETGGVTAGTCECREMNRQSFYGTYGAIFYLGILLSIVFLFAAVLIIYYKQISEGYEDQSGFEIMQKVGMRKEDIRRSINSQMLTIFFLPLAAAVMHLAFAFPMMQKLLLLFNMMNAKLFLITTGITILIFTVFYTLVYRITSNAYYMIVSGSREE